MRTMTFLFFFAIVLIIYSLANYYIFIRGWQALPQGSKIRVYYLTAFLILASSYIVGRILEKIYLSIASDIFVWIGSFWLAAMLYLFLAVLLIDIFSLLNHWIFKISFPAQMPLYTALTVFGLTVILLIYGYINACNPRIKTLDIKVDKKSSLSQLSIVALSDIHLGTIVGRQRFCRMVERINHLEPDLVLLAGDIVDEDLAPVIRENLGEALTEIRAKYGVYGITGNHEYIGGVEPAAHYLETHNVRLLRDTTILIEDAVYIVGREDRSISQFTNGRRKPLKSLLKSVDFNFPIILMDHQPFKLSEALNNKIDLQISGHTHHGQIFPINFVTKAIYEISWGYRKIGPTHYYVSSGAGTWGPPIRIGNHPEIVQLKLQFENEQGATYDALSRNHE